MPLSTLLYRMDTFHCYVPTSIYNADEIHVCTPPTLAHNHLLGIYNPDNMLRMSDLIQMFINSNTCLHIPQQSSDTFHFHVDNACHFFIRTFNGGTATVDGLWLMESDMFYINKEDDK